ncbi:MAG: hypothetical protein H6617_02190 [Bdellovibrionaceae bacterium]|nr:hypothetical protein [Bdellovibrionales bacterium]MCB9253475.1 hypothetical protein [Pseudobdellovibrionaceae bacterium]
MELTKSRYRQAPLSQKEKQQFLELCGLGRLEFDFREYLDGTLARLRRVRSHGVQHCVLDPGPSSLPEVTVRYPALPAVLALRKLEMDLWQWLLPEPYCQLALLFTPPPGIEIEYRPQGFADEIQRLRHVFDLLESHLVAAESSVLCVRTPARSAAWLVQSVRHRITHVGKDGRLASLSAAHASRTLTADKLRSALGVNSQYCELVIDPSAEQAIAHFGVQVDQLVRDPHSRVGGPPRDGFASSYELGL